jgi:hypothetical protein
MQQLFCRVLTSTGVCHFAASVPTLVLTAIAFFASCGSQSWAEAAGAPSKADNPAIAREPGVANFESLVSALRGKWTTLVYQGANDASQARPGHGEQDWRTGSGGTVLIEEEHVARQGGDIYLMALHWWDRSSNSLKGMLCNNSGTSACDVESFYRSKLNWDGHRLTVDLVFPRGPKLMLWHEEFGDFTVDSFTQIGEMGEVGRPLKRVFTIHAKRVGDAQNSAP